MQSRKKKGEGMRESLISHIRTSSFVLYGDCPLKNGCSKVSFVERLPFGPWFIQVLSCQHTSVAPTVKGKWRKRM